jgi:hypothetical protein
MCIGLVWPIAARSTLQGGQPKPKRPRAPKTSGDTGVRPYLEGTVVPLLMAGMQVGPSDRHLQALHPLH